MTKSLKKIASLFFILLALTNGFSQTDDKDISITSSGSGKTLEEAKQSALRSTIEQAFGAFISSKTEMFNDQVVADQMASVSSGNIKSYEVLNESQLPDGSWGVTLKAIVSVDKLTSFVEAKGIAIEIKGGMFALNIKQQLLNEQGEFKAVSEMVGLLHEPMQISFDYVIKSSDPTSLDAESKNWAIPLVVTATTNKNIDFCANYCVKTLAALSLSSEEVTSYQSLNKAVFPVVINYNGVAKTFYLRKQRSINALNTLTSQWAYYTRLFTVQSGLDEIYDISNGDIHNFSSSRDYNNDVKTINFLTTGQQAATFSWQDEKTLSQIEQMTGYKVKPTGVVREFKHGGFVFAFSPPSFRIGVSMKENDNEILYAQPGFIAEKAGLIPGDKIISINESKVVNKSDMYEILNKPENKDKLCEFKIERAGNNLIIKIYPEWRSAGLVAAITDLGGAAITDLVGMDWNSAKTACDELILNGYSDWYLPSKEELNAVYVNLKQVGVGGFAEDSYWSSTEDGNDYAWTQNFYTATPGMQDGKNNSSPIRRRQSVRCVRKF